MKTALACLLVLALAAAAQISRDSWVTDARAFRVGDLLTILIVEQGSGSTSASTNTKRENSLEVGVQGAGGPLTFVPEISGGADSKNEHKVKGGNTRASRLQTRLMAEIVAIDPDGTLIVEGSRVVEIDGEQQITELTGRVRPDDVGSDNTIYSYLVADAVIRYSGSGLVRNAQRRGVLNWLFGWML
ncbi:MAG: flagellar basal body L-ring protein FlgH [bacterium]|jgi:flagellar L-ring protein precursor FlgH|nr:flagellar basal body L-ring protein FlgH [bacterium]